MTVITVELFTIAGADAYGMWNDAQGASRPASLPVAWVRSCSTRMESNAKHASDAGWGDAGWGEVKRGKGEGGGMITDRELTAATPLGARSPPDAPPAVVGS